MGLKPRHRFRWDLSEPETYPMIMIPTSTPDQLSAALAHWWAKIAELAMRSEMFDTMVGDIWLDSGRIIGHVQMRDVAVGYDTGFRVAAHLEGVVTKLDESGFSNRSWDEASETITRCALDATALEPARTALATLREKQPFDVEITSYGQWAD